MYRDCWRTGKRYDIMYMEDNTVTILIPSDGWYIAAQFKIHSAVKYKNAAHKRAGWVPGAFMRCFYKLQGRYCSMTKWGFRCSFAKLMHIVFLYAWQHTSPERILKQQEKGKWKKVIKNKSNRNFHSLFCVTGAIQHRCGWIFCKREWWSYVRDARVISYLYYLCRWQQSIWRSKRTIGW